LAVTDQSVTFRWKDRSDANRPKTKSLPGVEFLSRYLRHVLPTGLSSVRYYGFCHPMAKAKRLQVQLHSGRAVNLGAPDLTTSVPRAGTAPLCPQCGREMKLVLSISPWHKTRGPPRPPTWTSLASTAA
jgi:hypothetical protein